MESDAAVDQMSEARASEQPAEPKAWGLRLGIVSGLVLILFAVYWPALRGPLISDDIGYLTSPYTKSLDLTSLSQMFDPAGDARLYTGNYAPVHLLVHAIERAAFGHAWLGYHVVNVSVHALNALLLGLLLIRSGATRSAALLGGLVFALHPANVEAVAWISQLKSTGALAFSLIALLLFDRRPALAAACFGLGLLTKASAAFALPAAAAFVWVAGGAAGLRARSPGWRWIGIWCAIFALYALPQFASFQHSGAVEVEAFDDPMTHLRTVAAIGARYLAMAASSFGVSAFAEPQPVESWSDPFWLFALIAGAALAWRTIWVLGARKDEAAWWLAAAAAFAPVSQIFPFLIPFADRYLYFILPGLIGGVVLCGDALLQHATLRSRAIGIRRGLVVGVSVLVVWFGVVSHDRAALWQDEIHLLVDAAIHYPDGGTAHFLRAQRAARQGDNAEAIASLRLASERGLDRYEVFQRDPAFARLRGDPTFRLLIFEMAGRWIARAKISERSTQPELLAVARAYRVREQKCEAMRTLQQALARTGPLNEIVASELASIREETSTSCEIEREEVHHRSED